MKKFLLIVTLFLVSAFPLSAQQTVVIREWNDNKNIDYLELNRNYLFKNLGSYTIKTVYSENQENGIEGGYDSSVSSFVMNCNDKKFKLNKTYYFRGGDLVHFENYDASHYRDDPDQGWKDNSTDQNQTKVFKIICK